MPLTFYALAVGIPAAVSASGACLLLDADQFHAQIWSDLYVEIDVANYSSSQVAGRSVLWSRCAVFAVWSPTPTPTQPAQIVFGELSPTPIIAFCIDVGCQTDFNLLSGFHPDTLFVVLALAGTFPKQPSLNPNLLWVRYRIEEGAFLSGVTAALVQRALSPQGTDPPPIQVLTQELVTLDADPVMELMYSGFTNGLHYVDPNMSHALAPVPDGGNLTKLSANVTDLMKKTHIVYPMAHSSILPAVLQGVSAAATQNDMVSLLLVPWFGSLYEQVNSVSPHVLSAEAVDVAGAIAAVLHHCSQSRKTCLDYPFGGWGSQTGQSRQLGLGQGAVTFSWANGNATAEASPEAVGLMGTACGSQTFVEVLTEAYDALINGSVSQEDLANPCSPDAFLPSPSRHCLVSRAIMCDTSPVLPIRKVDFNLYLFQVFSSDLPVPGEYEPYNITEPGNAVALITAGLSQRMDPVRDLGVNGSVNHYTVRGTHHFKVDLSGYSPPFHSCSELQGYWYHQPTAPPPPLPNPPVLSLHDPASPGHSCFCLALVL
eukprot:gene3748-696_t